MHTRQAPRLLMQLGIKAPAEPSISLKTRLKNAPAIGAFCVLKNPHGEAIPPVGMLRLQIKWSNRYENFRHAVRSCRWWHSAGVHGFR